MADMPGYSYPGQNTPTDTNVPGTDYDELYRVERTGIILSAFQMASVFTNFGMIRTISSGNGSEFDAFGEADAFYRERGMDLRTQGTNIAHTRFKVMIDGPLMAKTSVDKMDILMDDIGVFGPYGAALGRSLARTYDRHVATMLMKAAAVTQPRVPGGFGGSVITGIDSTDGMAIWEALMDAKRIFFEKDIPMEGRAFFVSPATHTTISKALPLINRETEGSGSVREGEVIRTAGFNIIASNNLPTSVIGATGTVAGRPIVEPLTKYQGDFTGVIGVVAQEQAVATVRLEYIDTRDDFLPQYMERMLTAEYMVGHDYFRPECAVLIKGAAVTP